MRLPYDKTNNRGQALVELAVLGSITIMLLAWMLGFGQNLNASQALTMHSFRQAEKLARQRSKEDGNFGSVSFTTIAAINPLNPINTKASLSDASGSGSIMWENELFGFATAADADDTDEDDSPITYYQIGETMINENRAIEWPTMKVKREQDEEGSRNYKDAFFNIFGEVVKWINKIQSGSFADDTEYWSLESQPVKETIKTIKEKYEIAEMTHQSGAGLDFSEGSTNDLITQTTFKMLDEATIKKWDDGIKDIESFRDHDIIITQEQSLTTQKTWENSAN